MKNFILSALFCLTLFSVNHARAALPFDMLALSIGYFDILDDEEAVDVRAEYRFSDTILKYFNPWLGVELTSEGSIFGIAGLLFDWKPTEEIYVTPSFGAGLYSDGSGKDLGHTIEFRSQLEIGYEFENGHRLGTSFSHTSNAGLGDHNPGAEVLSITYSVPIDWFNR